MATRDQTRDGTVVMKRSRVAEKNADSEEFCQGGFKRHMWFCQNKQMKSFRETIFSSEGFCSQSYTSPPQVVYKCALPEKEASP